MRKFNSGATRDNDAQKINYIGSFSPLVLRRFAEFMRDHNIKGGKLKRNEANWKKGMPKQSYIESKMRHFIKFWITHEGYEDGDIEDQLCADIFNAQGYLHELLVKKLEKKVKKKPDKISRKANFYGTTSLIGGGVEVLDNIDGAVKITGKQKPIHYSVSKNKYPICGVYYTFINNVEITYNKNKATCKKCLTKLKKYEETK